MASVKFYKHTIKNDVEDLNEQHCKALGNIKKKRYDAPGSIYEVLFSYNDADGILWIYGEYGNAYPYGKDVINKITKVKKPNPKPSDEIEMKHQIFAAYDLKIKRLFVSSSRSTSKEYKKIEEWINGALNITFYCNRIFGTAEEFLDNVKYIETLKVIQTRNTYNWNQTIFDPENYIFGYGNNDQIELKVKYNNKISEVKEKIKHFIFKAKENKKNNIYDEIVCVGKGNDGFEKIFNLDGFSEPIVIYADKNDYDFYNEVEVKEKITEAINNEYNERAL